MKRIFTVALLTICAASCNNAPDTRTLDEIEYFYLEIPAKGAIVHLDPHCAQTGCTYLHKDNLYGYRDMLCAKCISLELAKEIEKK